VPRDPQDTGSGRRIPAYLLIVVLGVLGAVAGVTALTWQRTPAAPLAAPAAPVVAPAAASGVPQVSEEPVLPAAKAPSGLPVIGYFSSPKGFPADPDPGATAAVTTGLRPRTRLAVYDAPGGRPKAFLPAVISGLPVTVPIVERRAGWVAVLLPSVNRTVGWLPAKGWATTTLRDQLIVRRTTRQLTWFRDGTRKASWTVAVGAPETPTPLGRTFVMGRTGTSGAVYAGLDALALGSVPDDRESVSSALRGAHTGIHAWYRSDVFGRNVSNGCPRMPPSGQRVLLKNIQAGTLVVVID
jgi:lipoprotein-anchoring transpeptidase ErfK/SrfK